MWACRNSFKTVMTPCGQPMQSQNIRTQWPSCTCCIANVAFTHKVCTCHHKLLRLDPGAATKQKRSSSDLPSAAQRPSDVALGGVLLDAANTHFADSPGLVQLPSAAEARRASHCDLLHASRPPTSGASLCKPETARETGHAVEQQAVLVLHVRGHACLRLQSPSLEGELHLQMCVTAIEFDKVLASCICCSQQAPSSADDLQREESIQQQIL